jgi:hypothetical protein
MTIRFCFYCGHGPVEEIGDYFHCTICEAAFRIIEVKDPQLTLEEAQAVFDKIPLTDKKAINAAKRKAVSSPKEKIS